MRLFSTEAVSKYHPDKYADQISDAILTECLKQDRQSHCGIETMVKGNTVAFRLFGTQVFTGIPMVILRGSAGICEGRFSSGRKAVRQTPCRIHSGRQSRPHFLAF